MEEAKDGLRLCLRWLAHELANDLSVLRAGLDLTDSEMTEAATSQLIGRVRAIQLVSAEGEMMGADWQENLRAIAKLREVELEFHCDAASFKQIQILTSLFLALIPKVIAGKLCLTANSTKTTLLASHLSPKTIAEIENILNLEICKEPNHIPFYLVAGWAKTRLTKQDEGALLEII